MTDVDMLFEPLRASLVQVGAFLPRVLLAVVILVVGWLVAKAIRFALIRALRAVNFNVVTEKAGIDAFLRQGGGEIDTIRVLGALAYWLVILSAVMVAFNSLDLGSYFARFVSTALTAYLRNIGVGEGGWVGRLALYAMLAFVMLIALDQLGLGEILRQTFLILVAAVALALALAFGFGGRRRAAELIESWTRQRIDRDDTRARSKSVL